jgi:hypothetical protein
VTPVDVLPDDVLLEIFDFYMKERLDHGTKAEVDAWHSLVHVCRRWRSVVFGSPSRLDLKLFCTPQTPSRDTLDVWPALPLIIEGYMALTSNVDNIVVALGHSTRVRKVHLEEIDGRRLEEISAAMQAPFPQLTKLRLLSSSNETPPVIPDLFLGGSAPRLRFFHLEGIPFPGLPKLLLSATHLVQLELWNIPHSGYFSPEAMAALLSVLSSLEKLYLRFESPQSCPDLEIRRPPPLKLSVIPSLTRFSFKGASEYLEDLVVSIDAPQLDHLHITFFNQIDFDTPRLAQFINNTPTFKAGNEAQVHFTDDAVDVELTYQTNASDHATSSIEISCRRPDWQLSSIVQACSSFLPPVAMVEFLYIEARYYFQRLWEYDAIENTLWLELLLPFTTVKNLYIGEVFAPGIAAALQGLVGGNITEVLPSLRNIFVERLKPRGPLLKHIEQFVAARQFSGHPVAIFAWEPWRERIGRQERSHLLTRR